MILLDTDHLTILGFPESERGRLLWSRLDATEATEQVGVTIVNIEEQMRGWLASIAKERQPRRQTSAYRGLISILEWFSHFNIITFDDAAAEHFENLRASKIRIGTMDLKIAAIALANDALLLTANVSDFKQVPALRHENWLEAA